MILRLRKTYMRLTVDSLARRLRVGDDMPKAERVVAILDDMVSPYPFFLFLFCIPSTDCDRNGIES